ncbi:MAG: hypothetical protein ALECFALPRED_007689 [Alectoria fallacina]|uniref:Uncharacterized protein n=1 Tax=Alectoria fallacina TaxID=1903189 RepID=A0A8H3J0G9_9LECA|nr:MAG: hypothetical protein ALECFALPRED_007689 [Alectoria fallacina]
MATKQKVNDGSPSSSDIHIPKESQEYQEAKPSTDIKDEKDDNINYPPPWTKKMKEEDFEELEQGRKMNTAGRSSEEEEEEEEDARLNWKKRLSNAGLM